MNDLGTALDAGFRWVSPTALAGALEKRRCLRVIAGLPYSLLVEWTALNGRIWLIVNPGSPLKRRSGAWPILLLLVIAPVR
jgi:hypothetical protein